jgi:glyoxylase-like metal-dependent hydrolase (beta-lactamase superfamily II)
MCPIGSRVINGEGGLFEPAKLVCHCLLIESNQGLVLVDTGFGTLDIANPAERIGKLPSSLFRLEEDPTRTAIHQLQAFGFNPNDLRHIVCTHLDFDHAGGLSDFPWAKVHVLDVELGAALRPESFIERNRYSASQFAHNPDWSIHAASRGESWFGFDYVRTVPGLDGDILLVPLFGHSRGHCGVAVRESNGWLLHCGDAVLHRQELDPVEPSAPIGIKLIEGLLKDNGEALEANQALLRQLAHEQAGAVKIICSHDPDMFDTSPPVEGPAAYAL